MRCFRPSPFLPCRVARGGAPAIIGSGNAGKPARMTAIRNVLFVMCDQLRRDHLSCYGGRVAHAASRSGSLPGASTLRSRLCPVGRVRPIADVVLHGPVRELARRHMEPRSVIGPRGEPPLGGLSTQSRSHGHELAGKTHVLPDDEALARVRHQRSNREGGGGALLREGGFVALDRYDGHSPPGPQSGYAELVCAVAVTRAMIRWADFVIGMEDAGGASSRAGRCAMSIWHRNAGARGAFRNVVHD